MSSDLPSPNDDYVATDATRLSKAVWNAVFGSIGSRIRALEAVQADFEALIQLGTGQALAAIAANIEPELVDARAALARLQADTAAAEDVVAAIVAGSIPQGSVDGLVAALAGKASADDVEAAIAALVGSAPATLDTIAELAAALDGDASAIATITAALGQRLRVDVAQGLSGAQRAQARDNLGLAAVAASGAYADLSGRPAVGTGPNALVARDANGVAPGAVVQIVTASAATLVSSTSATLADTGLSATITPQTAGSKILVFVVQSSACYSSNQTFLRLAILRGSTTIFDDPRAFGSSTNAADHGFARVPIIVSDDHGASAGAPITYKTQFAANRVTDGTYGNLVNVQPTGAGPSTIVLMEVAP